MKNKALIVKKIALINLSSDQRFEKPSEFHKIPVVSKILKRINKPASWSYCPKVFLYFGF